MDEKGIMPAGDDIFGRWAWPNIRVDGDPSEEHEPDTAEEDRAEDALFKLVNSNVPLDAGEARIILTALQSGRYRDVLKPPPPGSKIYRGMSDPKSYLSRALHLEEVPEEGETTTETFTFTPRYGESTSWTLSDEMARQYSRQSHSSGFELLMEAQSNPETMICGPGGFYRVKGLNTYTAEEEVIVIGPVSVTRLRWKMIP